MIESSLKYRITPDLAVEFFKRAIQSDLDGFQYWKHIESTLDHSDVVITDDLKKVLEHLSTLDFCAKWEYFYAYLRPVILIEQALGRDPSEHPFVQKHAEAKTASDTLWAMVRSSCCSLMQDQLKESLYNIKYLKDEETLIELPPDLNKETAGTLFSDCLKLLWMCFDHPQADDPLQQLAHRNHPGRSNSRYLTVPGIWKACWDLYPTLATKPMTFTPTSALAMLPAFNNKLLKAYCVDHRTPYRIQRLFNAGFSKRILSEVARALAKSGVDTTAIIGKLDLPDKSKDVLRRIKPAKPEVVHVEKSEVEARAMRNVEQALERCYSRIAALTPSGEIDLEIEDLPEAAAAFAEDPLVRMRYGYEQMTGYPSECLFDYMWALAETIPLRLDAASHWSRLQALQAVAHERIRRLQAGDGTEHPPPHPWNPGQVQRQFESFAGKSVTFREWILEREIELQRAWDWGLSQINGHRQRVARHGDRALQLNHSLTPPHSASKPSRGWLARVEQDLYPLARDIILDRLSQFQPMVGRVGGRSMAAMQTGIAHRLRGHVWAASRLPVAEAGPVIFDLVQRCLKSQAGTGILAERLANACLWTLEMFPAGGGAPYLARLLSRTRYPKVRKKIDAILNALSDRVDMSRDDLDELSAPDHGFDAAGVLRRPIGPGAAVLTITGSLKTVLGWEDAKGTARKAPPKALRDADPEAIGHLKADRREIDADLRTQAHRIERLYQSGRTLSCDHWRARYIDHGTVGPIARRLIWSATWPDRSVDVMITGDRCETVDGQTIDCRGATMSLWHPLMASTDGIRAWRDRLYDQELVQPFRQAWREIYRPTDAERTTGTYSNRFAGHFLRQHQMMALAHLNGWTCVHRMAHDVSNDEPTYLVLPSQGLLAEYWTEPVDDDVSELYNEAGTYFYLTTDRVAFYHWSAGDPAAPALAGRGAPMSVDAVPPIAFSEVMRHCDLFVSVSGIAADPNWMDRGADAEHPSSWHRTVADQYWQRSLDFEPSASAVTRREALEKILPRLAGRDGRFRIEGQYVHVIGRKRTYRIHIGSSAVLREPDGQHVCIIQASGDGGKLFLPFEGDLTLSMILSKALMLAQDDKITDPVILSQI